MITGRRRIMVGFAASFGGAKLMRTRRVYEVLLVALLLSQVFGALVTHDPRSASAASNLFQFLVALVAIVASARAALSYSGTLRWWWGCVAIALAQWSLGQAQFVYFENMLHQTVPTDSPLGPIMVLFVAPMWLGLLILRSRRDPSFDLDLLLDISQVALIGAAVYLRIFYVPLRWTADHEATLLGYVYDLRNFTLLASTIFVWMDADDARVKKMLGYFVIAFSIYSVGEIYYFHFAPRGVIQSGRLFDLIWSVPLALIGLAAVQTPSIVIERPNVAAEGSSALGRIVPLILPLLGAFLALHLFNYLPFAASIILFLSMALHGIRLLEEGLIRRRFMERWREEQRKSADTVSLLEATIESTADGMLVVDRKGKVVQYNSRFAEMFGFSDELLQRRSDKALLDAVLSRWKDPDKFLARVRELYGNPAEESFDSVETTDGRCFERLSRPQVLDGEIVGRVWSFRDVTQARKLEEKLRQSQKMEAVGTLAGGIAHDFNNLLTVIVGYTQLASTRAPGDPALKTDLQQISRSADQATALIRQLMTFSRKQMVLPVVLNVNECARETMKLLTRVIGEHIRLETDLAEDVPLVDADAGQFEQMLLNLAINARDAMPQGGTLRFVTRKVGSNVEITVSDTGTGISDDVLPHIFEPFFTTKEMGRGTGLGLAMVYATIEQSQGTINVHTRKGQGTTFVITIPATRRLAENGHKAKTEPSRASGTVLLVEDEAAVRELCTEVLRSRGYQVLPCQDAPAALEEVDRNGSDLDLLLTDVIMPGGSGQELVERVRSKIPSVKVLFMSGYDKKPTSSSGEAGPLITKPFTPSELLAKVNDVLRTG
jgi:PAS domain S-box-containing protein